MVLAVPLRSALVVAVPPTAAQASTRQAGQAYCSFYSFDLKQRTPHGRQHDGPRDPLAGSS